jgi:autotransporter-associated beta strand protein
MKPKNHPLLRASRLALAAITFGALPAFAGTTWDGGGADTNLGTGANWNVDDLAPAFDGTQNVTFSTAGTIATVAPAVNIDFNSITLNQASGFTIQSGAGTLRVKGTTTSSTTNGCINASGSTGMTISAPLVVNTGTIFNVNNSNSAATGLTLSGGLSASSGSYSFRLGGSGKTVISGTVTGVSGIQQSSASGFSGTVVFDCNLAAAGALNIATTGSGTVTAPKIQMGTSTSQTQSWTSSAIQQNSTIIVNSTATMTTLAIGAAATGGSSGATVEVGGNLSATTLTVGGAANSGNLKVSGTASFSGVLATGATVGSKIVGNAPTPGTLKLSSGSNFNSVSTVIGGTGTNENNLNLEKINSGTLTLTGINPYTGSTTVTAGILDITAATLSGTTALSVSASGTLGLSVSSPSTIPGTATFAAGSKVKLTGTATDGAVIMTASGGMSGTAPTLDPVVPGFITEISGTQLKLKAAVVPAPLNTWDAGASPDTNINTAANWGLDTLPDSTATVTFGDAGSTATVNVDSQFAAVVLNRNAAFNIAGPNNLILSSVNSSGSTNLSVTTAGGTQTINAPLQVDTTNTANKLLSLANSSTTQTLDINGSISRTSGSIADYALRFQNTAGSTTRIDGALNNLSGIQQTNSGTVAGDLVFGGDRTSTAPVSIASTGTGVAPATTARVFLGETPADDQTWGNLTLNNTIKLVVGGNITAGTISVGGNATAANTRIVGNSATNSTLSLTGGTINNLVTLGGAGTNENNLNLTKITGGILTLNGTHTYTGATTVNAGTLNLGGSIDSATTVNSGGAFNVTGSTSGTVTVNASGSVGGTGNINNTLTFGTGNSALSYSLTGPLNATSVDVSAATAIIVSPAATPVNGTPYIALKRGTGTFSGEEFNKFTLATRAGALSLTGGNTEITITPAAASSASLVWKGNVNDAWEASPVQNWTNLGSPDRFYSDDSVTFDETATSFAVNIPGTSVSPGNMVFNNTTPNDYTISGGTIAGTGSLTKQGSGTVTLAQTGTNTFSGALNLEAGVLSISHLNQIGGSSSTRAVTLKGGTLQYTGATVTTDAVPLVLDSGSSTVQVSTPSSTLRFGSSTTGSGNLVKTGSGTLALGKNGNNAVGSTPDPKTTGSTFDGTITVNEGSLDVRNSDSLGTTAGGTEVNNAILQIFPYGQNQGITITGETLALSGTSYFLSKNEDPDTDITNEWTGGVTVAAAAVVGLGSPRTTLSSKFSKFIISGAVSTGAGSVLRFGYDTATVSTKIQEIAVTGTVTGGGSVTAQGAPGSVYTLADPEYSGDTTVNSGTLSLGADNSSNNASTVSIAATGATLDLAFGGTDTVDKLYIGGVQQPAGDYTSAHVSGVFSGGGTLHVNSGPSTGYSAWQTANAPGQTVDQDHDNDGVDNGIEYFMGLSGNAFTANPMLNSANTIAWPMGATYTGTYGTDYVIQTSSDLTTWSPVLVGDVTIVPGTSLTYTLSGSGKRFVRLLVNPN